MLDYKIYLGIIGLVIGAYLVLQPKLEEYLARVKNIQPNVTPQPVPSQPVVQVQPIPVVQPVVRTDDMFSSLEDVIQSLDAEKDQEKIDYLINEVGLSLIKKRFNK